jgi:hypothetical protein
VATIASAFFRRIRRSSKPMLSTPLTINRTSQFGLVAGLLFAVAGAVFFLVGFALWSEVFLRFQEFQSYIHSK